MKHGQEYFGGAVSWATDAQLINDRSRRTAWIVAGVAVGIAAFEAVALAMMAPLKTVQPITLLVDRQTGFVQALDPNSPRRVVADEALTQSFLAQYVMAREGFDRATVSADYRRVALWSSGPARASYLAQMPGSNPESPFNRYPPGSLVSARVKSVSRLADGTAFVRFDTQIQDRNGRIANTRPWVSVVRYRYVDGPMSIEDRLINPLGFQVLSYRRDAEVPAMSAARSGGGNNQITAPSGSLEAGPPAVAREGRVVPVNQVPMGSPLEPATIAGGAEL